MSGQEIGSAKKNWPYHNALNLHKSKKQTVKDQYDGSFILHGTKKLWIVQM